MLHTSFSFSTFDKSTFCFNLPPTCTSLSSDEPVVYVSSCLFCTLICEIRLTHVNLWTFKTIWTFKKLCYNIFFFAMVFQVHLHMYREECMNTGIVWISKFSDIKRCCIHAIPQLFRYLNFWVFAIMHFPRGVWKVTSYIT